MHYPRAKNNHSVNVSKPYQKNLPLSFIRASTEFQRRASTKKTHANPRRKKKNNVAQRRAAMHLQGGKKSESKSRRN